MSGIGFLITIIVSSVHINGEILQCRVVEQPTHRILVNIVVNRQSYEVIIDSDTSPLWLIMKSYTLWQVRPNTTIFAPM